MFLLFLRVFGPFLTSFGPKRGVENNSGVLTLGGRFSAPRRLSAKKRIFLKTLADLSKNIRFLAGRPIYDLRYFLSGKIRFTSVKPLLGGFARFEGVLARFACCYCFYAFLAPF